jgi:phage major head subunit gpT-like protein
MPGSPVASANTFYYGLRTEFIDTYARHYDGLKERLSKCMALDLPTEKDDERYAFFNAAPHVRFKQRNTETPYKGFKAVTWTVTNYEWSQAVEWYYTDRQDDKLKGLVGRAREVGQSYALLDERVFFQIMQGSTDANLLPAVPTPPDGQALYAATNDGTNARFGITGGNILTGSASTGVATPNAIRTDFFTAIGRFRAFQDGEGQPLLNGSLLDGPYTIFYAYDNQKVFAEAFIQSRSPHTTTAAGNVAASNVVIESGLQIRLVPTQRITSDDWYIFLEPSPTKPIFSQLRMAPQDTLFTHDNSDRTRTNGMEGIVWTARKGYGCAEPYGTVKVDN